MEERVIGGFGFFAEKEVPQLAGQGEGDHEAGRGSRFALFTPPPLGGGGASTLRAAFVMTTVIGVLPPSDAALAAINRVRHELLRSASSRANCAIEGHGCE